MFPASYFNKTYFNGTYWPPTQQATELGTRNRSRLQARPFDNKLEKRSITSRLPARPFDTELAL